MDRARVKDEVIEVLCKKLYRLGEINSPVADIEEKVIFSDDVTKDELDIAEIVMDLEDAFGVVFTELVPGEQGLETVGEIIDHLHEQVSNDSRVRDARLWYLLNAALPGAVLFVEGCWIRALVLLIPGLLALAAMPVSWWLSDPVKCGHRWLLSRLLRHHGCHCHYLARTALARQQNLDEQISARTRKPVSPI